MGESYRNPFVIRQESGHPGFQAFIILAKNEDLARLGQVLIEESKKPAVCSSHYATLAHGQSSRVYLQFQSASVEELALWHAQPLRMRLSRIARSLILLTFAALAIVGLSSILGWVRG